MKADMYKMKSRGAKCHTCGVLFDKLNTDLVAA